MSDQGSTEGPSEGQPGETNDPYSAPQADLGAATDFEVRTVETGRGLDWVKAAFELFKAEAVNWVLAGVCFIVLTVIVTSIPLIGLLGTVLQFILLGGLIMGAHEQASGGEFKVAHVFSGFQTNTKELALLGLVVLGLGFLVGIIIGIGLVVAIGSADGGFGLGTLLGILIGLALFVPIAMATWFAVPLLLYSDLGIVEALKTSFDGCLQNMVPFLVYGLVMLGLGILAAIPFGLGFLVLIPVGCITMYVAYREIFYGEQLGQPQP